MSLRDYNIAFERIKVQDSVPSRAFRGEMGKSRGSRLRHDQGHIDNPSRWHAIPIGGMNFPFRSPVEHGRKHQSFGAFGERLRRINERKHLLRELKRAPGDAATLGVAGAAVGIPAAASIWGLGFYNPTNEEPIDYHWDR